MESLDAIRKKIDEIDSEMRVLFEKRMDCIQKVVEYKFNKNEKIYDQSREKLIIEKNLELLEKQEYKTAYHDFLQVLMQSSKDYQKEWIATRNADVHGHN